MYKKKLLKYFDHKSFYMQNKSKKLILKAFKKEEVYIVKYILSNFNEFTLLFTMHIQSKLKITLLKAYENL